MSVLAGIQNFLASGDVERSKLRALEQTQAVAEFDLRGNILHANPRFLDMFGYSLEEIAGRHHRIFVPERDRQCEDYRYFWDRLARGVVQNAQFKRIGKDGRVLFIEATYDPVVGRGGRPYKIVKFARDVTAEALRKIDHAGQIEALHRSQAVLEMSLDGIILSANDNFLRVFGYRLEDVVGRHHGMFVSDAQRKSEAYQAFWERLGRGQYQAGQFLRQGRDGRDIHIQASYNPIRDPDGTPLKIVKFASDITAEVQEQERRRDVQGSVGRDLLGITDATEVVAEQAAGAKRSAVAVLADVREVSHRAEELLRSARAIGTQVTESSGILGKAVAEAGQMAELIGDLSLRSEQIGQVIALIEGVASQTNLLALNATIEAARAGEAGRGFAVVAQEVKALAAATKTATHQITDQIAAVQTATTNAVEAIDEIRSTVVALQGVSEAIAKGMYGQESAALDVSERITTVSKSADEITENMARIASSTDLVSTATKKLREASQSLL